MLSRVNTIALEGIQARPVEVEVDLGRGLPALNMVGLAEGAVREAKDRVRSAIGNSGFQLPTRRITVNLAPADLPKEGSAYDLPMALGLLAAMEVIPQEVLDQRLFLGELSLDGRLKPVPGCLPAALYAERAGVREMVVPAGNGPEAALVPGVRVVAAASLLELVRHLRGEAPLLPVTTADWERMLDAEGEIGQDMVEVKAQEYAKRALEVAAAGGHNLLMAGPPGAGKTLLARCLPGILPPLSLAEALAVTAIYSVAGRLSAGRPLVASRPFRAPHHTASQVALIGGGSNPMPGEVSLAHRGILFLDEIPEFSRPALEVLREPLESGQVTISRAARSANYPAGFQLVAACNPCPCGHHGDPHHACHCSPTQVEKYRARLSGPLLDRIDLHVEVPPVPFDKLAGVSGGESSREVRKRVVAARTRQYGRNGSGRLNADLDGVELERWARLNEECHSILLFASRKLGFSARAYHRILKVARTIADLDEKEDIDQTAMAEAIQYRVGGRFPARG